MKVNVVGIVIAAVALAACSQQAVYESARQHQQLQCDKLQGAQYEQCKSNVSGDYADYKTTVDELRECEGLTGAKYDLCRAQTTADYSGFEAPEKSE